MKNNVLWVVEADLGSGYELLKSDAAFTRQDAREYVKFNVGPNVKARVQKYVPAEKQHN